MKKLIAIVLSLILTLTCAAALADITIGVPDDTTNEARALQLLEVRAKLRPRPMSLPRESKS